MSNNVIHKSLIIPNKAILQVQENAMFPNQMWCAHSPATLEIRRMHFTCEDAKAGGDGGGAACEHERVNNDRGNVASTRMSREGGGGGGEGVFSIH